MNNLGQEISAHKLLKEPMANYLPFTQILFAFAFTVGMIYMSFQNYLLFHSLIELFAIIIAFMMFAIAINTGRFISQQSRLISLLGISYGIVGAFDLLHTLAFKGMGVFPGSTANLATELWIASRYFQSVALLITGIFIDKPVKTKRILLFYIAASLSLFASIFIFDVFPDCFVEGVGLTDFKIISEIIISLIFIAGAVLLFLKRQALKSRTFWLLMMSVLFTIVSEIVFIFYIDVYGLSNMVGHITKLVAFYLIYKAIVEVSLMQPVIELTRSEKKYADLVESLPESILIFKNKRIVYANSVAVGLFGEAGLETHFADLPGGGSESARNGQGPMLERQVPRPDGSSVSVEIKTLPFIHQDEKSTMAIIYDVTERKSAEQVTRRNAELQFEAEILRKNEKEYLEIINGSTEASWILDFGNRTLNYSHEWKQRIGGEHVSDEDMDRFAMTLVHPDDVESVIRQRASIHEGQSAKYINEYRLKINTGAYIWVYDQGKIIRDRKGLPVKIYGTLMDITDRKNYEASLQKQNILLQNIIGNTYDNITVIDPDGVTLYGQNKILPGAGTKYGGDASGNSVSLCDEDGNEVPTEQLPVNRVRNGEVIKDDVYMAKSLAGSHYLLYGGKPVYSDSGQFLYGIIYSHDLTELISVQNALKQSEQRALELVEELKKADRNKNEFINALSHELRNPLAAIVAGFSLLNLSEDKQKIVKAKEIIQRQVNQLCHLIDDLLDLTRITNNKIVLKKQRVELAGLVSSIVEDNHMLFDKKGISLETTIDRQPISLEADPVRLKQIVGNLLQNAAKFTDMGGNVKVSVSGNGQEAVIRIKDSGIGIKPEFLISLFEPFNQAKSSIDRSDGGLGLGLSIVKGIVELHGGTVRANSEGPGKGAEFVISLPM